MMQQQHLRQQNNTAQLSQPSRQLPPPSFSLGKARVRKRDALVVAAAIVTPTAIEAGIAEGEACLLRDRLAGQVSMRNIVSSEDLNIDLPFRVLQSWIIPQEVIQRQVCSYLIDVANITLLNIKLFIRCWSLNGPLNGKGGTWILQPYHHCWRIGTVASLFLNGKTGKINASLRCVSWNIQTYEDIGGEILGFAGCIIKLY